MLHLTAQSYGEKTNQNAKDQEVDLLRDADGSQFECADRVVYWTVAGRNKAQYDKGSDKQNPAEAGKQQYRRCRWARFLTQGINRHCRLPRDKLSFISRLMHNAWELFRTLMFLKIGLEELPMNRGLRTDCNNPLVKSHYES